MFEKLLNIDADAFCKAAECQKEHDCLWDGARELCSLKCLSLDRFCCLKESCDPSCIYCTVLDNQSYCGCPVRVEIYKKYGV